ncbi:hypothetical protein TBLA_0F00500 [Henningerozyma blattae CBS 6284]|uniref:Uncharacterized protein n=1 Tax=Henningerozyma blattae (strain ATCC 34711 / CBS 6284 / DSM 70876 / NBRC 10599 / NRRL Y-10934 / UCD 77-7) TaxID=1071380 RepID=I2H5E2_HENB6|nr:hypothetical protein TBLA_0F00500 [Tetrapisispora blattae CBS 6284]CCH61594.1 hypothetical protein TBLA_0F00500 [Tetrapisispora blattae CBS 6284]
MNVFKYEFTKSARIKRILLNVVFGVYSFSFIDTNIQLKKHGKEVNDYQILLVLAPIGMIGLLNYSMSRFVTQLKYIKKNNSFIIRRGSIFLNRVKEETVSLQNMKCNTLNASNKGILLVNKKDTFIPRIWYLSHDGKYIGNSNSSIIQTFLSKHSSQAIIDPKKDIHTKINIAQDIVEKTKKKT